MKYEQALKMIALSRSILLTTHTRPDGDAVGSLAALKLLIEQAKLREQRSCKVELLFLGKIPENYEFLLDEEPWREKGDVSLEDLDTKRLDGFDLIIVADTSSAKQLPGLFDYFRGRSGPVLVIDHHLDGDEFGDFRLVDTSAAAAGEIVFNLSRFAGWFLDEKSATALFAAISTDCGWFQYDNTSTDTFRIAGELVAYGVRPRKLYQKLYQNFPPERLKLLAQVLNTLEMYCDNRLAVLHISNEMLTGCGAHRTLIENMVNESQQIGSVEVSILLVEQEDGSTRVSFRGRGELDVNTIARQFGGGGHAKAAGATVEAGLEKAKADIIATISKAIAE